MYAGLAGSHAAEEYANADAIRYLERTLELIGDFDAVERYDLTLLLGDVYKFAGNRKQARNHYSTILEELADSQVVARTVYQGRLCLAMSRLTLQEEPKSAVKWAVRGISAIDTSTEPNCMPSC